MRTIKTCGGFDGEVYNITVAFEKQEITLDGLSKDDMLELKSCIDCILFEEESDDVGLTS